MSSLLLLTNALQPSTEVLPALGLLLHNVRVAPAEGPALVDTPGADVILIDGRRDLPQVRSLCQLLRSTGPGCPLILVVTEGGLAAVTADWGIDDVLLDTAGPAEVEARLRLAMGRQQIVNDDSPMEIRNGDLSVDEALQEIRERVARLDARRVIIDSVSGFEAALAPSYREDFRESFHRLIITLSAAGITTFSTVETTDAEDFLRFSPFNVSFLTDDILSLKFAETSGVLEKVMTVVKMRGSAHSRELRVFEITGNGVVVGRNFKKS